MNVEYVARHVMTHLGNRYPEIHPTFTIDTCLHPISVVKARMDGKNDLIPEIT